MPAAALGSLITSVTCHNVTEGYTSQVLPPLPVWRPYFEANSCSAVEPTELRNPSTGIPDRVFGTGLKSGSDWNGLTPKVTLSSGGAGGTRAGLGGGEQRRRLY